MLSGACWRIGYQSIILGRKPSIADFENLFSLLRDCGFQGVEIAQSPAELPPYSELGELLDRYGLTLLGLAGGSLQDRVRYLSPNWLGQHTGRDRPLKNAAVRTHALPYLYVEDWDPNWAPAIGENFSLALHPHAFKTVQTLSQAFDLLTEHTDLLWLPDTAHLFIVGDDPARALRKKSDRLVAVHLKDWTPKFGRWSHRYARGFTVLGSGSVKLGEFAKELKQQIWRARVPGLEARPWLVVELDYPMADVRSSIEAAAEWLEHEQLLLPTNPKRTPELVGRLTAAPIGIQSGTRNSYLPRLEDTASRHPDWLYPQMIESLAKTVQAEVGILSACSPAHQLLSTLATFPLQLGIDTEDVELSQLLASISVERQAPTVFDLRDDDPGREYGRSGLKTALAQLWRPTSAPFLIDLPIFNTFNTNHARFMAQFLTRERPSPTALDELVKLGDESARVADAWLNDRCLTAVAEVELIAGQASSSQEFLDEIATRLVPKDAIRCQACSILLADVAGKRLQLKATTGVEWNEGLKLHERCYLRGEGLTGKVLEDRTPRLIPHARGKNGGGTKSFEIRPDPAEHVDALLLAPMMDWEGNVRAVIRCINKITTASQRPTYFSDDDLAVVDAISQAAVPHLLRFLDAERSDAAVERLKHEFKNPLVGIRANLDRIRTAVAPLARDHSEIRMKFLEDALAWSSLLATMLETLGVTKPELKREPTKLYADVLMPVVRQVAILAKSREYSAANIVVKSSWTFPPELMVDKWRLHQVFFNLLDNAIKYADEADPDQFSVEIRCERDSANSQWNVIVQDTGHGIDEGWEEVIFAPQVRAPSATNLSVAGKGLGLAVAREIIEAHGGTLTLKSRCKPTEFMLTFPFSLQVVPSGH